MKKTLALLMALLMAAAMLTLALAQDQPTKYTSGDYIYILLEDGTAEIVDYTGNATELAIPAEIDGYQVTSIRDHAFKDCDSLTSISIPDSDTSIGENPFMQCDALTSIVVSPDHPTLATIDGVLFEKTTKALICYPCTFTAETYTIPQGIRIIGSYAFRSCTSLTSVSIPDSVTSIETFAFGICPSLTSVSIPDSVTSIGAGAFEGCTSLTSVSIPDSVTSIGHWAFIECSSLTSVSIPDSVTSIGVSAFEGCTSLTSVSIPDSVTSIGKNAFDNCSSDLTFTVVRGSFAAQWCKENGLKYTYTDALDWLLN